MLVVEKILFSNIGVRPIIPKEVLLVVTPVLVVEKILFLYEVIRLSPVHIYLKRKLYINIAYAIISINIIIVIVYLLDLFFRTSNNSKNTSTIALLS